MFSGTWRELGPASDYLIFHLDSLLLSHMLAFQLSAWLLSSSINIVCVAEWLKSRAVSLHCTRVRRGPGSTPGTDTANQAVHPFRVG
jgi:hypothetical protein